MGARILVIEDEVKFARFVEMELTYEGYSVTKAFDGAPAWNWQKRSTLISSCST